MRRFRSAPARERLIADLLGGKTRGLPSRFFGVVQPAIIEAVLRWRESTNELIDEPPTGPLSIEMAITLPSHIIEIVPKKRECHDLISHLQ